MPAYKRVLLKLSGEALMGDDAFGINPITIDSMVSEIAQVVSSGVELAIVIGGGNIFRGVAGGGYGSSYCRLYGYVGHHDEFPRITRCFASKGG